MYASKLACAERIVCAAMKRRIPRKSRDHKVSGTCLMPTMPLAPTTAGPSETATGGSVRAPSQAPTEALTEQAWAYQARALRGVSRTFALTIPQLPRGLRKVVGNAYLLCRIADTIEDDPALETAEKREYLRRFVHVVAGQIPAGPFALALRPLLSGATTDAEKELVANTALVVQLTHQFRTAQRKAILRCVDIMTAGMAEFADRAPAGLGSIRELDRYCYHVAGVVGEMITDLACDHSDEIASRRNRLYPLSSDFGRGLQLVNILKDVWEDQWRGVSWLPREAFGGGPRPPVSVARDPAFAKGMLTLVGIARGHLESALEYALMIPRHEPGIRRFLLWTLGMAVLTLRRVEANPQFGAGDEIKIPRCQVRATVVTTSVVVRSNHALRWLFDVAAKPFPIEGRIERSI